MQSHLQLSSHWSTIPSQKKSSKSQRDTAREEKTRKLQCEWEQWTDKWECWFLYRDRDRCINMDYFEHRFIDRTARCPHSQNRSEPPRKTETWQRWRECVHVLILLASWERSLNYPRTLAICRVASPNNDLLTVLTHMDLQRHKQKYKSVSRLPNSLTH